MKKKTIENTVVTVTDEEVTIKKEEITIITNEDDTAEVAPPNDRVTTPNVLKSRH